MEGELQPTKNCVSGGLPWIWMTASTELIRFLVSLLTGGGGRGSSIEELVNIFVSGVCCILLFASPFDCVWGLASLRYLSESVVGCYNSRYRALASRVGGPKKR